MEVSYLMERSQFGTNGYLPLCRRRQYKWRMRLPPTLPLPLSPPLTLIFRGRRSTWRQDFRSLVGEFIGWLCFIYALLAWVFLFLFTLISVPLSVSLFTHFLLFLTLFTFLVAISISTSYWLFLQLGVLPSPLLLRHQTQHHPDTEVKCSYRGTLYSVSHTLIDMGLYLLVISFYYLLILIVKS